MPGTELLFAAGILRREEFNGLTTRQRFSMLGSRCSVLGARFFWFWFFDGVENRNRAPTAPRTANGEPRTAQRRRMTNAGDGAAVRGGNFGVRSSTNPVSSTENRERRTENR